MAKAKTVFFCQNCGYESGKWMGQCPSCHEWNTLVEEKAIPKSKAAAPGKRAHDPVRLGEIKADEDVRMTSGSGEFDRVLGGGIVKGSLVLIGGDPGIGKSTLLLQVFHHLSGKGHKLLYISGEESLRQIRMRADRLGPGADDLLLLCETDLDTITGQIEKIAPEMIVVDSIQTMYSPEASSAPGSVSQVREATSVFLRIAKDLGITVFIVGHVTKEGAVAGPRVLEHMVDTVLYFEGDAHAAYRVLRAVKNRFGSTNEIGVFEMEGDGLHEVPNPSEFMLSGSDADAPGTVITCAMEGSRPILLEMQALVSRTAFGYPRRTANGFDYNRLNLLIAVAEKRAGCDLTQQDAYLNVAGGLRITEPACDLAVILALLSSYRDIPAGSRTIVFGEVGLTGEVRAVSFAQQRVGEAAKLGFTKVVLPYANRRHCKVPEGVTCVFVKNIREAIKDVLG